MPVVLREQFELDGLPPNHTPSWKYITANTRYTAEGLNNKTQELYEQTLLEFLQEQGFGVTKSGKWPTDDEETIQSLEYFFESIRDRGKWAETTIDSCRSAINKLYEAIEKEDLGVELLDLGASGSSNQRLKNIQRTITIIEYMDSDLSDGTMENYTNYFERYFIITDNKYDFDFNPVTHALDEFEWYRSKSDPQPVTEAQLRDLWSALDALDECPVRGYDLDQWRLWMKVLLVFLIAVGPRSSEVEQVDIKTQFHFDDDPHVEFDERKNLRRNEGPDEVPIMMGHEFLARYIDYVRSIDRNGKLIPSSQSESGSRTPATLNDWLKRLCKIADVRLDDGSLPTIQNFRQFWKTQYKKAIHKNREQTEFVSDESGTKSPEVDDKSYISNITNRKHIRELGRDYFDGVFDLGETPALIQNELDIPSHIDAQSRLDDFRDCA